MDSYSSCDSEELYWGYKIISPHGSGLAGIVGINELSEVGRIEDILESIRDANDGLYNACYKGHKKLALMMIEMGATDFNVGLEQACWMGNEELEKLMIEKGATECRMCDMPLDEH
jgi:hypothetical protein